MKNTLSRIPALALLLFFSISGYGHSQSTPNREEIVLTTYYPTPYGDYQEMRATRMAVGPTYRAYSNVCWDQGKCNELIGDTTDLVVERNVGIGDTYKPQTPAPKGNVGNLDVNDIFVRSLGTNGEWISQSTADFTQTDVGPLPSDSAWDTLYAYLVQSWCDVPNAQISLDVGKYLVIFNGSTFHGGWFQGWLIRSDFSNVRFAWSTGASRYQALAGASGQGHAPFSLIEVITLSQPDVVRVQVADPMGGCQSPANQAYHGSFIVAKLK